MDEHLLPDDIPERLILIHEALRLPQMELFLGVFGWEMLDG